jgi:hypothetical protein
MKMFRENHWAIGLGAGQNDPELLAAIALQSRSDGPHHMARGIGKQCAFDMGAFQKMTLNAALPEGWHPVDSGAARAAETELTRELHPSHVSARGFGRSAMP